MKVTIKELYISPGHNYFGRYGMDSLKHPIVVVDQLELLAGKGIVDDRFFDYLPDYKGQITFFDETVHQKVCEFSKRADLSPQAYRRNVVVSGVDLSELYNKRFSINGIEMTGSGECKPCFWMDEAICEGAEEFLKGRGGLRARLLDDGILKAGEFELEILGEIEHAE